MGTISDKKERVAKMREIIEESNKISSRRFVSEEKYLKRGYNKKIIAYLVVICLLIAFAWGILYWNESRILSYSFDKENLKENFVSGDCDYWDDGNYVAMIGWIARPGEEIKTAKQYVILKDIKTGECYQLPTQIKARTEAAEIIGDGLEYQLCGFYTKISKSKFINTEKDYEIYIRYMSNENDCLVSLDTTIKTELSRK